MTDYNSLHKILIIRLSSLGDILLSTPLIRSLKKKHPHISIDFLLREEYEDVYKCNQFINKIFLLRKENKIIPEELTSTNYDLVIDLQNNFRSAGIRKRIKSKEIRLFNKRTIDKLLLVNFKINKLKGSEQIPVRYSKALDNFNLDENGLDLFTGDLKPILNKNEKKYIGFAAGSRHFTKMWPENYYISLGKKLNNAGFTIVLFGGNDDKELCSRLNNVIPSSIDLSNSNELLYTAINMKECLAVICNDSGLMHAACALKIPVLTFFGSTVREFGFTPFRNKNLILENNTLTCRPCSHIGRENCPKKHFKCMLEITPELAFDKLKELINP
ncbi:MAG TPA: glycosyltransferase family 9 protein [Ignavibacteriaceae bacterium]|nr:glycosyltransferase family 9 protein [Ignavibacteriaceae bacterium]